MSVRALSVWCLLLCCSALLWSSAIVSGSPVRPRPMLRGVTFRKWPYADKINDRFEGFVVDLLELIAKRVGFQYCFHLPEDGKYGGVHANGSAFGMVGEVHDKKADFAIADLAVTDAGRQLVEFTEPFVENQLAAIVRRDDPAMRGMRSVQDLLQNNQQPGRPVIVFLAVVDGALLDHLSRSDDPGARRLYQLIGRTDSDSAVATAKQAVDRVALESNVANAFLVESSFAEDLTGQRCDLRMLLDRSGTMFPRQFAVAMPRGSPYLEPFNQAIRELKASGQIQRLRQKYWTDHCRWRDGGESLARALPSPPQTPPQTPTAGGQHQPPWTTNRLP